MVSQAAIFGMIAQAAIAFLVPLGLFVYFYQKYGFRIKPFLTGILVFILFSQVLEKLMHLYMLKGNSYTAIMLQQPYFFAVYGALAAGIFEEVGRYFGFRLLLRRNRERRDGIALGLGHGGIESLLLGMVAGVQSLMFARMLNGGKLDQLFSGQVSGPTMDQLKTQLTDTPWFMYVLGGWERVPALLLHIALSIVVLYGIRRGRGIFLLYAILLHAGVDFFVALYQVKVLPIWFVEVVLVISAVASVAIIVRSKAWFAALPDAKPEEK
ncbi:MAG: hypothetical protein K0R75_3800 [Paenibacillaceae bacterium]|jgi:uncharacterized membrane protein YhfC|nr:hypothetical protein [Paenibacillaceae bacterium]